MSENYYSVTCPSCNHRFRAVPENVQAELAIIPYGEKHARAVLSATESKLRAQLAAAQDRLHEIVEIYTGMEGFVTKTAPEGYQQRILKQIYEVAAPDGVVAPTADNMQNDVEFYRDREWIMAMSLALGNSGFKLPLLPKVDAFKELFAELRVRGG